MRSPLSLLLAAAFLGSCGSTLRETESPAAAEPAAAPQASSGAGPSCPILSALPDRRAAPLRVAPTTDGRVRATSAEGGYAISLPASWRSAPAAYGFGQLRYTSYDLSTADLRMETTHGMVAPEDGIRLDIEVWARPEGEPLDEYAKAIRYWPDQREIVPVGYAAVAGQRAFHAVVQEEHRFADRPGHVLVTRQTRLLWLVPSPRADRVLVVVATPGESPLRGVAEAAVAGMDVFAPEVSQAPVVRQRKDVLAEWLVDASGAQIAGRRAEAKLVTYAEATAAVVGEARGLLRIDHDPDDLVWVVAVSGPGLPPPRRALARSPAPTPEQTAWMLLTRSATSTDIVGAGAASSTTGTWPSGFDDLVDRCR